MATAKKGTTRAKNPAGQPRLAGGAKKPAARKTNTAGKSPARKPQARRRNPSPGTNLLLFSIGGVAVVKGFDLLIRYVAPSLAAPITIIGMAAAAFGVSSYGAKYLGKWADIAAVGLGIFAALRAYEEYVEPMLPASFQVRNDGPVAVASTQPLVAQGSNTQLGTRFNLVDGRYVDAYDQAAFA